MILNGVSFRHLKRIFKDRIYKTTCNHCKYSAKSSSEIRDDFLNFFVNKNGHKFVPSSPVVPFCDPTVPFINAGMNQFKGIFLGQFSPPFPKVANSQKCIRVGGKHNDLNIVGTDGYHHTFFEMLGNWSFGDYYKLEACSMAWELLTGPYCIDPSKLCITYFGGDKEMGLEPDLECRDIWRRIGIPDQNLIAGNKEDNFWEMGTTGPCGPCTEIYYRRDDNSLVEIWNIVFIQFNRQNDRVIDNLPKCHIDTGMGLERLTALLQNKSSNYDTDIFLPLFEKIHEMSGNFPKYTGKFGENSQLDTAYRTLADHSRMISICLADGVYPCRNLRLRNVIRKSITISNQMFKCPFGMLSALHDEVSDKLGKTYPELVKKNNEIKQIINQEEQMFYALEKTVNKQRKELLKKYPETVNLSQELTPGLADGYKHFKMTMKNSSDKQIPSSLAFKLYDTFGLDEDMINKVAQINNLSVDINSLRENILEHKSKHKAVFTDSINSSVNMSLNKKIDSLLINHSIGTDDSYKYKYNFHDNGTCEFQNVNSQLVQILTDKGDSCDSVDINYEKEYHLIFKETNFYCEEGGQLCDIGQITLNNGAIFNVRSVAKIQGLVLHSGKFTDTQQQTKLHLGDSAELVINKENRVHIMQHHTATHLLNAAIKKVLPDSVTCQLSSRVTESGLILDLAVYGGKLSTKAINDAQELVRMACSKVTPVKTRIINSQDLLSIGEVTTVPGEIYPETGLRLVEIDLLGADNVFSRELCCGTHVPSTHLVKNFCITGVRGAGGHSPTIRAVAGDLATQVYTLANQAQVLHKELEYNDIPNQKDFLEKINCIRNEMNQLSKGDGAPYGIRAECLETLSSAEKKIKEKDTKTLVELVKAEMASVMSEMTQKPFVVHFLICSYLLEPGNLSLTTAIECGEGKPIFILGCACGIIKATCHVPQDCVNANFTAEKWMQSIIPTFNTYVIPPTKNQNPNTLAHMKGKKVSLINCESLVADAIERATIYADKHLQKSTQNDNGQWQNEGVKKRYDHSS